MKVAYIAGPYRGKTLLDIHRNINRAEYAALKYWEYGYAVICPHKNTAYFDGQASDAVWLDGDLELLARSDVVVMLPNWAKSTGAKAEHKRAQELGKEIHYFDPDTMEG